MKNFKFNFNSIYSRILFFNLLPVVGITIAAFTLLTNYFIGRYNYQINQDNLQLVRQMQNYIDDTVLEKIEDAPNDYFSELGSNYELTYPYYTDISDNAVMITEINNRIHNIMGACNFISGINLYYVSSNLIFSNAGVSFVGDEGFQKSVPDHEQIISILKDPGKPTEWLTGLTLLGSEDPSVGIFVKTLPFSISEDADKKAVLAISINTDYFYRCIC